jgi:hypothetical protein
MNTLWIGLALVAAAVVAGAIAILVWLRHTLLSGIAVVDVDEVDPALLKQVERLEMDYAVAEELGYGGDVLLGIESQLNAARFAAAASANVNPETATAVYIVSSPAPDAGLSPAFNTADLNAPLHPVYAAAVSLLSIPNAQLVPTK